MFISQHDYILVGDDEDAYALVIEVALKRAGIICPVTFVKSRPEVIAHLAERMGDAAQSGLPLPVLVLLGFRLPLLNGFPVLRFIRSRPELNTIPTVVLAGAEVPSEADVALALGAVSYHLKPFKFECLVDLLSEIGDRWLVHSERQPQAAAA